MAADLDAAFLGSDFVSKVENVLVAGIPPIAAVPARIGPPMARPGKVTGIEVNYRGHANELGDCAPTEPIVFLKASSILGPHDDVEISRGFANTAAKSSSAS